MVAETNGESIIELNNNIDNSNKKKKKVKGFGGKKSAEESSNPISRITFWWGNKFIYFCFRNVLQIEHIWNLASYDTSDFLIKKIETKWNEEKKKAMPSFLNASFRAFGISYIWSWLFYAIYVGSSFVGPIILKKMVTFVSEQKAGISDQDQNWGYYYGLIIFGCSMVGSLCQYQSNIICSRMGDRLRSVIVLEVYKKALRLSNAARGTTSVGHIVNLMSNDAQRMLEVTNLINAGIFSIPQIIVCIVLLYQEIKWVTFIGFGFMVLCIPLNGISAKGLLEVRKILVGVTDGRMKITTEILQSIKIIKLYAWEDSFAKKILEKRQKEVELLFRYTKSIATMISIISSVPTLATILVFSTYYGYYKTMDPARIFAALSYLNILRVPMSLLPIIVALTIQMKIAGKRVTDFLLLSEITPIKEIDDPNTPNGLYVKNGSFCWNVEKKEESFTLKNIDFEVHGPTLTMVVGSVGSGKSSLMNALLGEMDLIEGDLSMKGSVAYVAQQAWITNATLRDNILFGKEYNEERYRKVIEVCALERDLELFPQGDLVEIGERGVNLSGGQKQRVSIARAVYSNSDIYILDDPLSALDSHVSKHIFYKCFKEHLSDKTVVLAANQLNYIPFATNTLVLKEGRIDQRGTYREIMDSQSEFSNILREYGVDEVSGNKSSSDLSAQDGIEDVKKTVEIIEKTKPLEKPVLKNNDGSLTQNEEREEGAVSWRVFYIYASVGGGFFFFVTILLFLLDVGTNTFVNWWLSHWQTIMIKRAEDPTINELSDTQLLGIYIGIGVVAIIFGCLRTFAFYNYAVRVGRAVFLKLFNAILRAPMWFFDITPLGRIISRFSRDQDSVDNLLVNSVSQFLITFINALATIILVAIFVPLILAPMAPIAIVFFLFQYFYRFTSRELQRIESISRSPIFSHFTETLNGVETIRSYRKVEDSIDTNQKRLDENNKCYLTLQNMNQWLGLRLDFLGNLVTFFVCVFITVDKTTIAVSSVGLVLSYSFNLTAYLNRAAFQYADIETKLNSLERIYQYIKGPVEAPQVIEPRPKESWPENASITFDNFYMSYREGLDPVLKGISLEIRAKEKIGIVGRTGSGKSSMTAALFRLVESLEGRILIDGDDISKIGLKDLRRNLSIIPQDPVVFAGTVRDNLDPFNSYSDEAIWKVLEDVQLTTLVNSLESGLLSKISEGGENISVGQRQLICLGRALLKKPKILVLDEATASVDGATDALIQKVIREKLNDTTLLIIAHRLNTIIDSDRIIVLDSGKISEFDTPWNLLQDKNSLFSWLIQETGPSNSIYLYNLAKAKHDGVPLDQIINLITIPENSINNISNNIEDIIDNNNNNNNDNDNNIDNDDSGDN
ncbi:hypothetical protein DICPUDRAFT_148191 [Dictyostelium purpureum]|uniref:ABC transporter C family protein n=1 Tax=Dictyostelium purpureum TaxID=5786 RepID=F0ZAH6_DICPU|nr:uncharacterized protein DICPUDRAFT_148191 [Dictyostelium purpureum]EGC39074.1 hypothetical protein DICPUDRAFT_148191 [Dictyostelium purpureum]|eukprot:XP_003284424.1 hypothetical protein DICPUDRAFT_148191 [Dictyostelium purpureum]